MFREYLIWSNQHSKWWGPNKTGYTGIINGAGRYTQQEAEDIVKDATAGGLLKNKYYNSTTDRTELMYDEVMVRWVDFDPKEPQGGLS